MNRRKQLDPFIPPFTIHNYLYFSSMICSTPSSNLPNMTGERIIQRSGGTRSYKKIICTDLVVRKLTPPVQRKEPDRLACNMTASCPAQSGNFRWSTLLRSQNASTRRNGVEWWPPLWQEKLRSASTDRRTSEISSIIKKETSGHVLMLELPQSEVGTDLRQRLLQLETTSDCWPGSYEAAETKPAHTNSIS